MAVQEWRKETAAQGICSVLPFLDSLTVVCNGFSYDGFLEERMLEFPDVISVVEYPENRGSIVKYIGQRVLMETLDPLKGETGFYFPLDDDILYPADYVNRHLAWQYKEKSRSITCFHGRTFNPDDGMKGYLQSRVKHPYYEPLESPVPVLVGGSATSCIPVPHVWVDIDYDYSRCDDLYLAARAALRGVGYLELPHSKGWITPNEPEGSSLHAHRPREQYESVIRRHRPVLKHMYMKLKEKGWTERK
jgi:hypothetical protein